MIKLPSKEWLELCDLFTRLLVSFYLALGCYDYFCIYNSRVWKKSKLWEESNVIESDDVTNFILFDTE